MIPSTWVATLGLASLEGASLVAAAWLITWLFPRLPAYARTLLWWAVCVRLLVACVPNAMMAIPVANPIAMFGTVETARSVIAATGLEPAASGLEAAASGLEAAASGFGAAATRVSSMAVALPAATLPMHVQPVDVMALLAAVWALGVLFKLGRWIAEALRVERAWRSAQPWQDATVEGWLHSWLGTAARRVEVRRGSAFATPLVLLGGGGHILVPEHFASLSPADQRAGLAHEVAHLRRHDLVMGTFVALCECVYWFHPLVALAAREYAAAREEACDAEAIRLSGTAPADYGALLLRFGVEPMSPGHVAASCGSRHVHQLRKRIIMLNLVASRSFPRRLGAALMIFAAVLVLLPVRFLTPALAAVIDLPTPPPAPASRAARATSATPSTPATRASRATSATTPAPLSRTISRTVIVPDEPEPSRPVAQREFSFGRLRDGDWFFWGTFDERTMKSLKRIESTHRTGDLVWFKEFDRAYLVRDAAAVAAVNALLAPMESLSGSQTHEGREQAKLGALQEVLGAKQEALGEEQVRIEEQIEAVSEQISEAADARKDTDALERRRDELHAEQHAIEQRMRAFEHESQDLERQMDSFGDRESAWGDQMDQMMDHAGAEIRRLVKPLVDNGKAEAVRP